MARLAWSISFWARPRRLWDRFTAWKTQTKSIRHNFLSDVQHIKSCHLIKCTSDVMCPCGTSSGSSSLKRIWDKSYNQVLIKLRKFGHRHSHLCQDISHNFTIFIFSYVWELKELGGRRRVWNTVGLRDKQSCRVRKPFHLRPGQSVIKIVFHLVIFWET